MADVSPVTFVVADRAALGIDGARAVRSAGLVAGDAAALGRVQVMALVLDSAVTRVQGGVHGLLAFQQLRGDDLRRVRAVLLQQMPVGMFIAP
ncbi:hypothetical protein ACFWOT_38100 [Streptomyces sp. NPDC058440]|uniref:hypothetical protein n=1 Tax=Streptomyces sp. NPDC058440 TaxID=3346501 RepID=UPI00365759D8